MEFIINYHGFVFLDSPPPERYHECVSYDMTMRVYNMVTDLSQLEDALHLLVHGWVNATVHHDRYFKMFYR